MQGEDDLDFKIEIDSSRENDKNNVQSIGSNDRKHGQSAIVSIESGKKGYYPKFLKESSHPGFCILHLAFKTVALLSYLLMGLVMKDKTFCFILVVSLCAVDFWVTKNLTGR